VTAFLADVESDLSAIHRINDMYSAPGPRVLRLAYRLAHYEGCVRHAVLAARQRKPAPERPDALDGEEITWVDATPEAISRSPMARYFTFGQAVSTDGG
jgi:hypothetical protein